MGRLHTIVRRLEPDDLEAQVKALKELQQLLGIVIRKPVARKKDSRLLAAFKKIWAHIVRLFFKNKQKPVLT